MKANEGMMRRDLMGDYDLSDCPSFWRREAATVIKVLSEFYPEGYWEYDSMSEAQKVLMAIIWMRWDGITEATITPDNFLDWFKQRATDPTKIRRAQQWLRGRNYLLMKSTVIEDSHDADGKVRQDVVGRRR